MQRILKFHLPLKASNSECKFSGFFQLLDLGQAQERDENLKWTKSLQEISETYAAYMIIIGDRKWTNLSHSCFDCSWIVFVTLLRQNHARRGVISFANSSILQISEVFLKYFQKYFCNFIFQKYSCIHTGHAPLPPPMSPMSGLTMHF